MLFRRLVKTLGSVDKVLGASVAQLTKVEGGVKTAERIARTRGAVRRGRELQAASKLGVCVICLDDPRYPAALRQIYDPPVVLYVKGSLRLKTIWRWRWSVAAVQSIRPGAGKPIRSFLARTGFTVVSGGARGSIRRPIAVPCRPRDATIVVQGCGLAHLFPPENKELFERIAENGAIISELPLAWSRYQRISPVAIGLLQGWR